MTLLILLSGILALPTHAQSAGINEVSLYLRALSELESALENHPECAAYTGEAKIACSEITDSVCHTIWNRQNKGNMPVFDGEIAIGKTKGKLAKYELAHYQALADSWPKMAPDIQRATKETIDKLKAALAAEEDSKKWRRTLLDLKNEFSRAMYDVADSRQKEKHPEIMAKPSAKRTVEESNLIDLVPNQIEDEVLDAVYGEHPNWLRVKKAYAQAKADIIASVGEMKIPNDAKKEMVDQLKAAELTLPYTNDYGLDAEDACSSTTVNAYYFSSRNELVVCAGLFNGYQSESSLYFVLAHELGHSIDTTRLAQFDYRKNSSVLKGLSKLSIKDEMSCAEWEKTKKDVLNRPAEFAARDHKRPLEKLISCLKDRSKLKPMDSEQIKTIADHNADGTLAWYAARNRFLKLAQPTILEDGELRDNPYYLRPDRYTSYLRPPFSDGKYQPEPSPTDIFYRELTCAKSTDGKGESFPEITDKAQRAEMFKNALEVTRNVLRAKAEDWFSYCGKGCSELTSYQLASNSNENSADWHASQATKRFLGRLPDQAHRREASALSTSLFCAPPSAANDAPELAVLEREFSQVSHPDDRIRRISLYGPEISDIVGCSTDSNLQGFSQCTP